MSVESAADRAVFFDTGEHAVDAEWTLMPGGAKAWPVSVILSRGDELVGLGEGSVQLKRVTARIQADEIPAGAAKGDVLTVGSDSWTVERFDLEADPVLAEVMLKAR